ncbi:MAG: 1-deoxy-D-xylulose-5-phosphate reductoisomerase [Acidobacteriia bacterium]|nr:1-deoxy-D-xylulose-5-phosphate reductoisomerase [Terriglobia bacterium]
MTKGLCILGSTGSVGQNSLRVARNLSGRFRVVSLAAGRNLDLLANQIRDFEPQLVSVGSADGVDALRERLSDSGYRRPVRIVAETAGHVEAATLPEVDFVISSFRGVTGLQATYEAIRAGKQVGLANKEVLVVAGEVVSRAAAEHKVELLPIDSEHSALHQCLRAGRGPEVRRLILTASGGPFLRTPREEFDAVTPDLALKHPIWRMGSRITIDSATLFNKGLEVIEAHWLFGLPSSEIEVMIHPESVVHSMVEFRDGTVMAQLSVADMRLPIQYALTYPERVALDGDIKALDLLALGHLSFEKPDHRRFPCLDLARAALEEGGAMPCALNAADEIAVEAFLAQRLRFSGIPRVIEQVMRSTPRLHFSTLDDVFECDCAARERAREVVTELSV